MNPALPFERAATQVWTSEQSPDQKCSRLHRIHRSIRRSIDRLDARRDRAGGDPWAARTFDRLRGYLVHLAADVQDLALQCEKVSR